MWQEVAVLYSAVFFTANHADVQSTCVSDAPDNCTFEGGLTSCKWPFESNVWNNERYSAAFGASSSSEANVTSRTACRTGQETHCLQISYLFDVNNASIRVLLIRVRDEDDGVDSEEQQDDDSEEQQSDDSEEQQSDDSEEQQGNDSKEQKGNDSRELAAWNGTDAGIGVWHNASIPIQSKDNFSIIVEAKKFTADSGKLLINYIRYIKAPCSTLPTSIAPSPLTNTQEQGTTTIVSHISTNASNNAGVVVGVVVTVIVIVIAVVFFILYRRKQFHLWKTCFRNKNEKDATDTSHSGERSVGKYDKSTVNGVKATPTVSGHNNHAFPASESQPSDTYYSVIKDTDESGDSTAPHYSTIQECQSADGKTLADASKLTDDDPFEIKTEHRHLTSRSAATRHVNAYANLKGKTGGRGNPLAPASNGDNRQAPSDYSLARGTGDEATGVYHCLEEDPNNHGEGGDTGLYHYAKDPDLNPEAGADAKGVYHILEENPVISRDDQSFGVYHEPKVEQMGQQTAKVSKRQTGNYNTLDFVGKSSDQKTREDCSGGVYNHLGAESDDPYNEVDRDVRLEVIDGEYSHIKLSDC